MVTYETREDFARTALTNIERYMGRRAESDRHCEEMPMKESSCSKTGCHLIGSCSIFPNPGRSCPMPPGAAVRRDLFELCSHGPSSHADSGGVGAHASLRHDRDV